VLKKKFVHDNNTSVQTCKCKQFTVTQALHVEYTTIDLHAQHSWF
jgi:hypothetical protein